MSNFSWLKLNVHEKPFNQASDECILLRNFLRNGRVRVKVTHATLNRLSLAALLSEILGVGPETGAYFGYFLTYVWIKLFECDDVRSESPVTKRGGGKPLRRLSETQEKEKSVGVLKFNCRFQNCFSSFCLIRKSGLNMKKLQSWKKCPRPKPKYQPLRDTQKLKLSGEWGKYLKIVI